MGIAISVLLAALAVVYSLSVITTTTPPVSTILRVLLDMVSGQGRLLSSEEAISALFYSIVVYLIVFSASYFVMRFLGTFLLALGVPDDQALRQNRELRRTDRAQLALQRRQAKLNAQYIVRAQQEAQAGRPISSANPPIITDDFTKL